MISPIPADGAIALDKSSAAMHIENPNNQISVSVAPTAGAYVIVGVRLGASYEITGCACTGATCSFSRIRRQGIDDGGYTYNYHEFWGMANAPSGISAVTCTGSDYSWMAITVYSFTGVATSSAVESSDGYTANTSSTTWSTPNLTIACTESVLVAGLGTKSGGHTLSSVSDSFTKYSGVESDFAFEAYRIVSSAGTYSTTFTLSSADRAATQIISLKASDASCGGTTAARRRIIE